MIKKFQNNICSIARFTKSKLVIFGNFCTAITKLVGILSWEIPYTSYSFKIERNIIVATFFFTISQTEFRLVYNQKEIIRNHHIPFNLKRNKKYILLSVCLYVTTTARPQATIHHVAKGNSTFSASLWASDWRGVSVHMLEY